MPPRGRPPKKNRVVGTTRMDAALDAMLQYGFEKRLVRETVQELLDVYEGNQGWPFIEDASYKLLIETILGKQQNSEPDKEDSLQDNARRHDVAETSRNTEVGSSDMVAQDSSLATARITEIGSSSLVAQDSLLLTARITEIGSSSLVAHDSLLHTNDGLDSASQTNDQDSASPGKLFFFEMSPGKLETDKPVPTNRGGNEPGMRAECKTEQKLVDDVKRSSHRKFASNAESTVVRDSGIESSKTPENVPRRRREPFHGWIGSNGDGDGGGLVYFALPPLHKQIELLTRCAPGVSVAEGGRVDGMKSQMVLNESFGSSLVLV